MSYVGYMSHVSYMSYINYMNYVSYMSYVFRYFMNYSKSLKIFDNIQLTLLYIEKQL